MREPLHPRFWLKSEGDTSLDLSFDYRVSFQKESPLLKNKISEHQLHFSRETINPEAHPGEQFIPDYLPIGGGSMLNLVKAFNIISGQTKKIERERKKELQKLYQRNVNFIESFKPGQT